VPIKGDMFTKVIQFLQDLGIVGKCEEEGWNGLSDKILQNLRVHFRRLIPFRFQPDHQSQIGWAANSSLGLLPGDADIHRPERSMLSRDRVEEIQDMDIDSTPSSRRLDSRALPTLAVNRVTKTKRKQGATSVRRQVQSTRDLTAHQTPRPEKSLPLLVRLSHHASRAHRSETQHETHGRDPQDQFPQAPTQCWTSAPNDPGQWHLATSHQDDCFLPSSVSVNDRGRGPLSDITLNAPNVYSSNTDSAQYMQDVTPGSRQPFVSSPGSEIHGHCDDADIHRSERSILGHERVEESQDIDVDIPPSSRTLDSRALPRQVANRVTKTKPKKGTTPVRRQLQSFARDLTAHQTPRPAHRSETQHETHGRDPQGRFPRAPTQCWTSTPNDPGQWHLATNPRIQLQLSVQRKVADTAKSIRFAMKGDIRALKSLFSEGLASPVEVSNSRELSLIGVGHT
jgi:hypothetical protein